MAGIQLGGLFTGINTTTLIQQLLAAEQGTLNRYKARQVVWSNRETALNDLETKLKALRNPVGALTDASELQEFSVASSDAEILTAAASNNAFEGNHSVVVNQLASAERWVHTVGKEYEEDTVGAGTFIYSYHHQETTIVTTAETTLEDLVGLINNDSNNPGVTANLLYHGGMYHLVLNGNDVGSDYAIAINASNTEVWQAATTLTKDNGDATGTTKITELDQFDGTLVGDETITIGGTRHDGTAVNQSLSIDRNTKLDHLLQEIEDALGGTATAVLVNGQIRLTDNTSGASQMTLSLTYNAGTGATTLDLPAFAVSTEGGSAVASLAGFAAADFTETQSAQDSQIRVDGYPGGTWITRSSNTISDVIHGVTLNLHNTGTAQVDLTQDTQAVRTRLNLVVAAYNAAVTLYQEKTGYNQTTKTAGVLMGDVVISDLAESLRTPLIQQAAGSVAGADSFTLPAEIGLTLDGDGKLSLTTATLDAALATDYAGVLALIGAAKTTVSDSNVIRPYGVSSEYTTAGTYDVEVTVAGGVITSARIKLEGQTAYRDAGIEDDIIVGNSAFDAKGVPLYAENGLQLSVDRSQDGTFTAQVRVRQGFAGALADALDRILDTTTGTLTVDRRNIDDQIEHLGDQITVETDRLKKKQSFLVAKFARLERTLALLQNQMAALGMDTGSSS
ncbi:MAG: flagellar filament capping protein FliD [Planctomycetes bacterium]|jgi:flagellar hook-associated protein 2|nr:flagellar filament capping protein FliD [Planctomycetota bacterium]